MLATLLAIAGTLAGAALSGAVAHVSQRAQRRAAQLDAARTDGVTAITTLIAALADHRRAMVVREDLRLAGADWADARAASHATRSAISAPLREVSLLLPTLTVAAHDAARATYALREATDTGALQDARLRAARAAENLSTAAADLLRVA
ncbi:protein kilB (plasmid) [Streptomyces sp. BI20]|uniref:protein kilB n=1 Tax=Streptomyces sp. BI20 TaxID=3403460 RepID=UPI003C781E5D